MGAFLWAACLILLALQGATGLTASVAFALGLLIIAAVSSRAPGSLAGQGGRFVLIGAVLVTGGVWLAAVAGFETRGIQDESNISIIRIFTTAVECLAMSFGQTARRLWPMSGVGVLLLIAGTILLLLLTARHSERRDRLRALLLVLAILAPCMTALAVGFGRQLQGGLLNRYSLIAASLLCAVYFSWMLYGPASLSRLVQVVLFSAMCASSLYYASEAFREGKARRENTEAFLADVFAGRPLTQLVAKHDPAWVGDEKRFRRGLLALRDAGIVPFDSIVDDPPLREVPIEPDPSVAQEITAAGSVWRGTGRESRIIFSFEQPAHVIAIRCAYVLNNRRNSTQWETSWVRSRTNDPFRQVQKQEILLNFNSARSRNEEVVTTWIDEPISAFAISPCAEACEFRIIKLELLVREGEPVPRTRSRGDWNFGAWQKSCTTRIGVGS